MLLNELKRVQWELDTVREGQQREREVREASMEELRGRLARMEAQLEAVVATGSAR